MTEQLLPGLRPGKPRCGFAVALQVLMEEGTPSQPTVIEVWPSVVT
jgi:hypothetical protein